MTDTLEKEQTRLINPQEKKTQGANKNMRKCSALLVMTIINSGEIDISSEIPLPIRLNW